MDSLLKIRVDGKPIEKCVLPSDLFVPYFFYPRVGLDPYYTDTPRVMHSYICRADTPHDMYHLIRGFVCAHLYRGCEPLHVVSCNFVDWGTEVQCQLLTAADSVETLREQIRGVKTEVEIDKDLILETLHSVQDIETEAFTESESEDESEDEVVPVRPCTPPPPPPSLRKPVMGTASLLDLME